MPTTATEIRMRAEEQNVRLAAMLRAVSQQVVEPLVVFTYGREVCARRAKVLRKRGETVRFKCRTVNGKSRYAWLPRFRVTEWALT